LVVAYFKQLVGYHVQLIPKDFDLFSVCCFKVFDS